MGGKPSKGTPADGRLKGNKGTKAPSAPAPKPMPKGGGMRGGNIPSGNGMGGGAKGC